MTIEQLQTIEVALGVVLPEPYKTVMVSYPWPAYQASNKASLWDDPDAIVEQTRAQRAGVGGAPPWPDGCIVIGDEDDACPYALDCRSGKVVQTDHGDLKRKPLAQYPSISELVSKVGQTWNAVERKPWWKVW